MSAQPSGVSIAPPNYNYYSGRNYDVAKVREYHDLIRGLMAKFNRGEPIHVVFNDERRRGSIGRIKSWNVSSRAASSSWYGTPYETFDITDIKVCWDDRKNVVSPTMYDIKVVPEWTGETKYVFEKPEPKKVVIPTVYDRMGEEIKVGNFVSFIHQKYGRVEMMYGTITRINENGTVWAKNMKMSADDRSEERRIRDNRQIVIMEKNFMDKLMMFKLSIF